MGERPRLLRRLGRILFPFWPWWWGRDLRRDRAPDLWPLSLHRHDAAIAGTRERQRQEGRLPHHTRDGDPAAEATLEQHLTDPRAERHGRVSGHDGLAPHQHRFVVLRGVTSQD